MSEEKLSHFEGKIGKVGPFDHLDLKSLVLLMEEIRLTTQHV